MKPVYVRAWAMCLYKPSFRPWHDKKKPALNAPFAPGKQSETSRSKSPQVAPKVARSGRMCVFLNFNPSSGGSLSSRRGRQLSPKLPTTLKEPPRKRGHNKFSVRNGAFRWAADMLSRRKSGFFRVSKLLHKAQFCGEMRLSRLILLLDAH